MKTQADLVLICGSVVDGSSHTFLNATHFLSLMPIMARLLGVRVFVVSETFQRVVYTHAQRKKKKKTIPLSA